jgi:hypothetical protein
MKILSKLNSYLKSCCSESSVCKVGLAAMVWYHLSQRIHCSMTSCPLLPPCGCLVHSGKQSCSLYLYQIWNHQRRARQVRSPASSSPSTSVANRVSSASRRCRLIGDQDARRGSAPWDSATLGSYIFEPYVFNSFLLSVFLHVVSDDKLVIYRDYMNALRRSLFTEIASKGLKAVFPEPG